MVTRGILRDELEDGYTWNFIRRAGRGDNTLITSSKIIRFHLHMIKLTELQIKVIKAKGNNDFLENGGNIHTDVRK